PLALAPARCSAAGGVGAGGVLVGFAHPRRARSVVGALPVAGRDQAGLVLAVLAGPGQAPGEGGAGALGGLAGRLGHLLHAVSQLLAGVLEGGGGPGLRVVPASAPGAAPTGAPVARRPSLGLAPGVPFGLAGTLLGVAGQRLDLARGLL